MASLVFTSKSFKYLIRCEHAALWPDVSGVYARVRLAHSGLWAHLGGGHRPSAAQGCPPRPPASQKEGVLQALGITTPTHTHPACTIGIFFLLRGGGGARWGSVPPVCPGPRAWHGRGGRRGGPGCSPGRARTQVVNVAGTKQANPTQPLFKQTTRGSQGCAECEPDSSGLLRL